MKIPILNVVIFAVTALLTLAFDEGKKWFLPWTLDKDFVFSRFVEWQWPIFLRLFPRTDSNGRDHWLHVYPLEGKGLRRKRAPVYSTTPTSSALGCILPWDAVNCSSWRSKSSSVPRKNNHFHSFIIFSYLFKRSLLQKIHFLKKIKKIFFQEKSLKNIFSKKIQF